MREISAEIDRMMADMGLGEPGVKTAPEPPIVTASTDTSAADAMMKDVVAAEAPRPPELPAHVEDPALPPHGEQVASIDADVVVVKPDTGGYGLHAPKQGILRIRESVHPALKMFLSLLPFAIVAVWWVVMTSGGEAEFRKIAPTILPSPEEVAGQVTTLMVTGQLLQNILVSLTRVICGFAIAITLALPLGILMGASGKINATFNLSMTILSYLPVPAIVPLTMAWWGSGEKQKIGFLALVTFCGLLPQVVRAISSVEHRYVLSAYSQGATAWQIVSRVMIPIAIPDIFSAIRMCLGIGWTYILLVEVIKAGEGVGGVGNLIMVYHRLGHMSEVYLTVVAIMIVGALMDRTCRRYQKTTFPWKVTNGNGSD